MKVGLGAATYLGNEEHVRLAIETVKSAVSGEHELVWAFGVTHLAQPPFLDELLRAAPGAWVGHTPENCVSAGWNLAMKHLFEAGCERVIVPNLDIRFKSNAIDRLVAFSVAHPEYIMVTGGQSTRADIENEGEDENVSEHPQFSCFMVQPTLPERVGWFDENFHGAYNEDLDMHWRIRLAGEKAVVYGGARYFHHGSATIRVDGLLMERNRTTHAANDAYFRRKWGYKPPTANDPFTESMYRVPFNGAQE